MDSVKLNDGSFMPRVGLGTWEMGETLEKEEEEIEVVAKAIEMGVRLIDTAEYYADGNSERIVGEAIRRTEHIVPREEMYIVSKVMPSNAGRNRIYRSCQDSLDHLGVTYLDMYLLHWRGGIPLSETVECLEDLKRKKKIRRWGVSNFDISDMEELLALPNGNQCMINQVLYHLGTRGIEYSLIPYQEELGIPIMAYSPIARGGRHRAARHGKSGNLFTNSVILDLCKKHNATPAQILLAFSLINPNIVSIPKTSNIKHLEEIVAVFKKEVVLDSSDIEKINKEFPPPNRKYSLDMY